MTAGTVVMRVSTVRGWHGLRYSAARGTTSPARPTHLHGEALGHPMPPRRRPLPDIATLLLPRRIECRHLLLRERLPPPLDLSRLRHARVNVQAVSQPQRLLRRYHDFIQVRDRRPHPPVPAHVK